MVDLEERFERGKYEEVRGGGEQSEKRRLNKKLGQENVRPSASQQTRLARLSRKRQRYGKNVH
jgi:hypothetical protein